MSPIKPESAFDQVSRLDSAAKVLTEMEINGGSVNSAVKSALNDESLRKNVERTIAAIEQHYNLSFFMEGRTSKVLSTDQVVRAILPEFKSSVRELVREKENLLRLNKFKPQPEVSVGTWAGIALYFIPGVLMELQRSLHGRFDLSVVQGDMVEHFRQVQSHRLDMALLPSGDKRAKQMQLTEVTLNYRRQEEGVVFLYSKDKGASPFPKLLEFLNYPKKFNSDRFLNILRSEPVSLVHRVGRTAVIDFDAAISELLARESADRIYDPSGQRFRVPTYRHDRLLVRLGLAVGCGAPPSVVTRKVKMGNPTFEVLIGKESINDESLLAYFPPQAFGDHLKMATPLSSQTFSLYLRDGHNKEPQVGGLSKEAKKAIDVIKAICKWRKEDGEKPAPWLTYDSSGSDSCLVHDVMQIESLMQ